MGSNNIGAKLRQQRLALGLTIDDISRDTKIGSRFLQAIESDDFESLPGLVFTRNFVRQFALSVKLDPHPLLAELPTQNESTIRLPDPPAQSSYSLTMDRRLNSTLSSAAWLLAAGAAIAGWLHFNHAAPMRAPRAPVPGSNVGSAAESGTLSAPTTAVAEKAPLVTPVPAEHPVEVVITAHQPAWIQVSADGKIAFTGTLQQDEMKAISADDQVRLITGNAGALTISLNGKTLEPLGPLGQVRAIRLTAEGPVSPLKAPPPAPDPL